jgi:outer membrane autotransporter protein
VEWFARVMTEALKETRTYLVRNGVWVRPQAGFNSYAKVLQEVVKEEARHEWTDTEIQEHTARHGVKLDTRIIANIAINTPLTLEPSLQGGVRHIPGITLGTKEEVPRSPYQAYERFNPTPHPIFS